MHSLYVMIKCATGEVFQDVSCALTFKEEQYTFLQLPYFHHVRAHIIVLPQSIYIFPFYRLPLCK